MTTRKSQEIVLISSTLKTVLANLGLTKALSRQSVIQLWPRLVSHVIARHARIDRISGDTVFVIVDSAVWMSELTAVRFKILEKINGALDPDAAPFKEIKFIQRSWARAKELPKKEDIPIPEPNEKQKRMAQQILTPLKDETLREIVSRIVEKDRRLKELRTRTDG